MKKAQRSQRKWLKLSLKIDFFGMKNYKKSWVDPPVSHYIYIYSEAQVDLAILRVLPQQEPGPVKSKIVFVGLERYVKEI